MTRLFPAYLDLGRRNVLVVGGGNVAARKVRTLLDTGARITVVAPQVAPSLKAAPALAIERREFRPADLDGKWLVLAATDDPEVNRNVAAEADRRGIFCNVADAPALCSFHVPAVVRRGLLQLAVSTGGASPALARNLRRRLQRRYGPAYEEYLDALMGLRRHIQKRHPSNPGRRREIMESFLDSQVPGLLLSKRDPRAFARELARWKSL